MGVTVVDTAFITKYRPTKFSEIVGQAAVVRSLQALLKKGGSKTFLFTGPSGTGKTTLARIVAKEVGCAGGMDLIEIDVASQTGVDDMRAVIEGLRYRPLGEGTVKVIICNEAHMLSKQAWNSLLMALEEPAAWIFWILCTTEPQRVPANIRTRCTCYDLKPVPVTELLTLLDSVVAKEKLAVAEEVVDLCAEEAQGSPRQALANLAVCSGVKNVKEAQELLRSASAAAEAIDLARALVKGSNWAEVQRLLNGLQDTSPESVRHLIRGYLTKTILGSKNEAAAGRGLELLSCFDTPFNPADGASPLVLACGRAVLS